MAVRKAAVGKQADSGRPESEVEKRVVALAEQLGWFVGKVEAKAEGWLESEALARQVSRIRDGASDLLEYVNRAGANARAAVTRGMSSAKPKSVARTAAAPKARASRGPVDAPGKRHRKPPPQERLDKRMGEPVGKKMGQKQFRVGKSRGRG